MISGKKQSRRLDTALEDVFPQFGLRARRRLWESCLIQVNGRSAPPGMMVNAGDSISITPLEQTPALPEFKQYKDSDGLEARPSLSIASLELHAGLHVRNAESYGDSPQSKPFALQLIAATGDFIALSKPAGIHSANIAGSVAPSLEGFLLAEWPHLRKLWRRQLYPQPVPGSVQDEESPPLLLTRLDLPTSGIVLSARNLEAAKTFRIHEKEGKVHKTYFALIDGILTEPLRLTKRLDTDNRAKSKVLEQENEDSTRHTEVTPLQVFSGGSPCPDSPFEVNSDRSKTLVRVEIQRGARHQIRAHLAAAGFPLFGDSTYNPHYIDALPKDSILFLHHARVIMPGFNASVLPDWVWCDLTWFNGI